MSFLDRLEFVVKDKLDGNWAELSRKSGLGASTLHQIRNGADPKASSLKRICGALGISMDWLTTGEGQITKEILIKEPITKYDVKIARMVELLDGLNEDQQREIFTIAEEKKRFNNLERMVEQLLHAG